MGIRQEGWWIRRGREHIAPGQQSLVQKGMLALLFLAAIVFRNATLQWHRAILTEGHECQQPIDNAWENSVWRRGFPSSSSESGSQLTTLPSQWGVGYSNSATLELCGNKCWVNISVQWGSFISLLMLYAIHFLCHYWYLNCAWVFVWFYFS